MAKCLGCGKPCNNEGIAIIDNNRKIDFGYTFFYNICNRCQTEILKTLEVIPHIGKSKQDKEERQNWFSETRNWCRKCWQTVKQDRWVMIFIDSNSYVKNTSYVHNHCCKEIQKEFHFENQKESREKQQTCLS